MIDRICRAPFAEAQSFARRYGEMVLTAPVMFSEHGEVALIELARPDALNALNDDVNLSLLDLVRRAETEGRIKVLVIAGRGRAFSSGADLKHMRGLSTASLRRFIELTWAPLEALARSPLVSIAALHGHVLGGGAELALACDMRIASKDVSFGFPEMTLGSVPGSGGMQRLPEVVGAAKALELVTTGRRLGADEVLLLGLVNHVAQAGEQVRDAAFRMAGEIAERPAESLRYAKLAMRLGGQPDVAAAFHGLVSSVRQSDPSYRTHTARFEGKSGDAER